MAWMTGRGRSVVVGIGEGAEESEEEVGGVGKESVLEGWGR